MTGHHFKPLVLRLFVVFVSISSSRKVVDAQILLNNSLNPVADPFAQIPNCRNFGIMQGETLNTTCAEYCGPNETEIFDYADSEEDVRYVVRNTVCRCFDQNPPPEAQTNKSFECWSKAEVWDKMTPIMKCTDNALNISSQSDCKEFCADIDPIAYGYAGSKGKARCSCHDALVCDDIGAAGILATATAFGLLLGSLALMW